jgi:hypothetical protein
MVFDTKTPPLFNLWRIAETGHFYFGENRTFLFWGNTKRFGIYLRGVNGYNNSNLWAYLNLKFM